MQNESRNLFTPNNFESTCFTRNVFYAKIVIFKGKYGAFSLRTRTSEIVWNKYLYYEFE